MPAELTILPGTLAQDCYPSSAQLFVNELLEKARVQLDNSGWSVMLFQESTPDATQRTYLWFKISESRVYSWNSSVGAWVSRHPYTFGSDARMFWTGTLASLETFDGGEAGSVGDAAGPMWQRDTSMNGRMAIGVGTLPSGATLVEGATGGEDLHTMTIGELVAHTHTYSKYHPGAPYTGEEVDGTNTDGGQEPTAVSGSTGSTTPFNVMNPYKAGYWIRRSSRVYYRG